MTPTEVSRELERARADFHRPVSAASADDLRRRSDGTRWTNRQLLFHMVLGYLVVRTLLPLVHALGTLGHSRGFAAALNATRRPFHLINYLGSCFGGQILSTRAMAGLLDRTMNALHCKLAAETDRSLAQRLHFPTAWDPYFTPTMSVLDVYHFGTRHFDHHRCRYTRCQPPIIQRSTFILGSAIDAAGATGAGHQLGYQGDERGQGI